MSGHARGAGHFHFQIFFHLRNAFVDEINQAFTVLEIGKINPTRDEAIEFLHLIVEVFQIRYKGLIDLRYIGVALVVVLEDGDTNHQNEQRKEEDQNVSARDFAWYACTFKQC